MWIFKSLGRKDNEYSENEIDMSIRKDQKGRVPHEWISIRES